MRDHKLIFARTRCKVLRRVATHPVYASSRALGSELEPFDWFKTAVIGNLKELAVTCRRYFRVYVCARPAVNVLPRFSSSYIYLWRCSLRSCTARCSPVFTARGDQGSPIQLGGYLSRRTSRVYIILPHLPRRFGSCLATTPVARKAASRRYTGSGTCNSGCAACLLFIPSSAISRGHGRKQYLHATAHPRPSTCTSFNYNRPLPSFLFGAVTNVMDYSRSLLQV